MAGSMMDSPEEQMVSHHTGDQWLRRERELAEWTQRMKRRKGCKRMAVLGGCEVDAELVPALAALWRIGIETEHSCAGVSPLDEPEDHSLYAYVTLPSSALADRFVEFAAGRMKHRLLVTFEPGRNRYDLSSFFIGHNRSFCLLLAKCAGTFEAQVRE